MTVFYSFFLFCFWGFFFNGPCKETSDLVSFSGTQKPDEYSSDDSIVHMPSIEKGIENIDPDKLGEFSHMVGISASFSCLKHGLHTSISISPLFVVKSVRLCQYPYL